MTTYTDLSVVEADPSTDTAVASIGLPERGSMWSTLADVCKLLHLDLDFENEALDALFQHRCLKPGQHAYRMGQAFDALYVVNTGFLKTVLFDKEGNERVVAFPMEGDLLGSDGISQDSYACEVVALSDCELIVLPFRKLLSLGHGCKELEHLIYRLVSRQVVHEQANLVTLGTLRSDARVARFLSIQAEHHEVLKFSPQSFRLRMTRREIGSYLGLTLETVSRSMSALDTAGIIAVDQRSIKILKPEALRAIFHLSSPGKSHRKQIA
ncbi:MAG: Crp/Fnr family transcriptional regulator [Burkholderiaceae bacterium]|nr:Crp/Fnr family transcriptional regulator [Burkholderiaceae bacterium]